MGLSKYTGPLAPPPSFLDPAREAHGWTRPNIPTELFEPYVVDRLLAHGLTIDQALDVAANVTSETGWHEEFAYWNCGGVKATKGWAERYLARTGVKPQWWRTHGNVGTGDATTVFYRAYASLDDFLDEWLLTFVPKPGTVGDGHLYRHTGELFWSGGDWFPAMVRAGYKGPVTAAHPQGAIDAHKSIVQRLTVVWAQARLGLTVDAKWGPKSQHALNDLLGQPGSLSNPRDLHALATLTSPRVV